MASAISYDTWVGSGPEGVRCEGFARSVSLYRKQAMASMRDDLVRLPVMREGGICDDRILLPLVVIAQFD